MECNDLIDLFYRDLKKYNHTNFQKLVTSDLSAETPDVLKTYSSVVTRFFIFSEKHPEVDDSNRNLLYFLLRIDMVARYFSEYPRAKLDHLKLFRDDMREFIKDNWESDLPDIACASPESEIALEEAMCA